MGKKKPNYSEGNKVRIKGNPFDEQLGQHADNHAVHTIKEVKDVSHMEGTSGQWVKTDKIHDWMDAAWFVPAE